MWLKLSAFSFSLLYMMSSFAEKNKTFLYNKERNKFQVYTSLQGQASTISSKSSGTSLESDSSFSIVGQTINGEYFFNDKFSLVAGYYTALVLDIDAEVQGVDLGVHYFPMANGVSKELSFMGSSIETSPEWSPFLYLGASTRDYQFSNVSLKFQGIEAKAGTYWHFEESYFLRGDAFFQQHQNNNVRTLNSSGIAIGLGTKF